MFRKFLKIVLLAAELHVCYCKFAKARSHKYTTLDIKHKVPVFKASFRICGMYASK